MGTARIRVCSLMVIGTTVLASACAATSSEVKVARASRYQAPYDEVWDKTVAALAPEYPIVKVLDKDGHRIVTCWRPIDKDDASPSNIAGEGWRLYRAIVEISKEAPFRVSVSGRAALFEPPVVKPLKEEDLAEPYWRAARTDRLTVQIHDRLKATAVVAPAGDAVTPPENPLTPEVFSDTCVMRPEMMHLQATGMKGIAIGTKGAMGGAD